MAFRRLPSIELVGQRIGYNPKTGVLIWKLRTASDFKDGKYPATRRANMFNAAMAGKPALSSDHGNGYLAGNFEGVSLKAHRVAYAIMMGRWPNGEIDHINGNRSDNRWSNLREVSRQENTRNRKVRVTCKSGVPGVYRRSTGKWAVSIGVNTKRVYLGQFNSLREACCVRKDAERRLGYHPNHGAR